MDDSTQKQAGRTPLRWKVVAIAAAVMAVLVATAVLVVGGAQPTVGRTIELSMKDFAFNGTNPTLKLYGGETVRIVVKNEEPDPRVLHKFRIPGIEDATCKVSIMPGESKEFVVRVPRTGEFIYTCCTHPGMGGAIQIADKSEPTR